MANSVKLELNHDVIEDLLDDAFPVVEREAKAIADRANSIKGEGVKDYEVKSGRGPSKKYGYRGGRKFAIVVADDYSTKRDNAKNNTLLKALG